MEISFIGKRVLVTGAGQGIGRELVKALVHCKAEKVYALSRTKVHLDSLCAEEPTVIPVVVDLSNWNKSRSVIESLGQVDCLVNNAGIAILEPFLEIKEESFDQIFNVNVKTIVNVSQVIAKEMIKRKRAGSIVNVSSQASQVALKNHTLYGATKAAVDSITKQMALELGTYNIRVNAVNPTVVMTAMGKLGWTDPAKANPLLNRIPLGRFAECDDVVNVILFLLSDKSSMVNSTTLLIDGGFVPSS